MATQTRANDRKLRMGQAMVEAIAQMMESDPTVFCLGEDIGKIGGVFQSTAGLRDKFGAERVRDTPISETAILGAAFGAAVSGMRPIAELMFVDFMGVCFDQLLNSISKTSYMSGGSVKVPMVVTASTGAGISDAAQHAQSLHGFLAHMPGLKVVIPSTPFDAKGLMISAIKDDDPVIYLFHRSLLGLPIMKRLNTGLGEHVPMEPYAIPFGEAQIVREGSDITVVALSEMVHKAWLAAERLADDGISVEVLDPRTIVPLDRKAILASVRKTGRLLIADEDYLSFGFSGEIAALIAENLDSVRLRAPVSRVALRDIPIPYSAVLENAAIPQADDIAAACIKLMTASVAG